MTDYSKIDNEVEQLASVIWDMAEQVWDYAELSYEEFKSSALESAVLAKMVYNHGACSSWP
ncbi:hypothetical protein JCM19235_2064 [Vibrio maritimus]|uniref:Site-specific DNA-methyltransferase (adenine-specific) n=1 Tax=Vibrio maritimus TaxID=990268 RepID=A0A090RTM6_9VIBR|nr:hypothetical protein JCM19235_2064 [Vibrio maritimus]